MPRYTALIILLAYGFHAIQVVRAEDPQPSKSENKSTSVIGSIFDTVQQGFAALGGSRRKSSNDALKPVLSENQTSNQTQDQTPSPETSSEPEENRETTLNPLLIPDIIPEIGNLTNNLLNNTESTTENKPIIASTLFNDILNNLNRTTTAISQPFDLSKQIEDNVAKLLNSGKPGDVATTALAFITNTTDTVFKIFNDTIKPLTEQVPKTFAAAQDIISKVFNAQAQGASLFVIVPLILREVLNMISNMFNSYVTPITQNINRVRGLLKFFHLM